MKKCAGSWKWVSLGLIAAGGLSGCAGPRASSPDREWWGPGLRRGPIISTPACDCPVGGGAPDASAVLPPEPGTVPAPIMTSPADVPIGVPPAPPPPADNVPTRNSSFEEAPPLPPPPPPRQGAFSQLKSRLFSRKTETPPYSAGRGAGNSRVARIDEDRPLSRGGSRVRPVQYDSDQEASREAVEGLEGERTLKERVLVRDRTHIPPGIGERESNPFESARPPQSRESTEIPAGFDNAADGNDNVEPWPYHEVTSSLQGYSHAVDANDPPAYPHAPARAPLARAAAPVAKQATTSSAGSTRLTDLREEPETPVFEEEPAFDESSEAPRGAQLPGQLEEHSEEEDVPAGKVQGLFPLPTIEPGPSYQRHRR